MRFIKKIKDYFVNYKIQRELEKKEEIETKQRQEELVKIVENLKNIDLFGKKEKKVIQKPNKKIEEENFLECKEREEQLVKTMEKLKNIKLFDEKNETNLAIKKVNNYDSSKKINIITMINIDKMNSSQLQNTYKCVKKSIEEAKQNGKTEQLNELVELKNKIKSKLIKENDDLNLQSIKCNLMLGNIEKIDIYESVLIELYNEIENNSFKGYDSDIQQMKIHILSLIKLINKIKKSNKTYIKKIA